MPKDVQSLLSDTKYAFNGEEPPELEFGVMLKPDVVLEAIRRALRAQGMFWRQGGAMQMTFYRNVAGVSRPIPVHIELWRINFMQTRVCLTADYGTKDGTVSRALMRELNSLKQIFQIELCSQPGAPTPAWLKKLVVDPAASPFVLSYLSKHKDAEIRTCVADNALTPLSTLQQLAADADVNVRYAIAENHNICRSILTFLTEDENPYVACRAAKTLLRIGRGEAALLQDLRQIVFDFEVAASPV